MTLSTFQAGVAIFVAILALTALAASVAAYFRASYVKATVVTLQENNAALTDRVRILTEAATEAERERAVEVAKWEAEREVDRGRIRALETENGILRDVVQGRADITNVVDEIQHHHTEVMANAASFHQEWRTETDKAAASLDDLLQAAGSIGTDLRAVKGLTARRFASTSGGTPT